MSFVARDITVQLSLAPTNGTFDGQNNTLYLTGLRIRCTINATVGGATPFQGQMQCRIEGMRNEDMAQLSTLGLTNGYYTKNLITVFAGDMINGMSMVFTGSIFAAIVDYNSQPEVGIEISASNTLSSQIPPTGPSGFKGNVSVATMLQQICAANNPPLNFVNNGVTASLNNHSVGNSGANQIADICLAVPINYDQSNETLTIWPIDGTRDNTPPIEIDSNSGMVGYPQYSAQGIDISMEFNPNVILGRQMTVTSSIPTPGPNAPIAPAGNVPIGASGTFWIYDVVHELHAQVPNGPWFTKAKLGTVNTQLRGS